MNHILWIVLKPKQTATKNKNIEPMRQKNNHSYTIQLNSVSPKNLLPIYRRSFARRHSSKNAHLKTPTRKRSPENAHLKKISRGNVCTRTNTTTSPITSPTTSLTTCPTTEPTTEPTTSPDQQPR